MIPQVVTVGPLASSNAALFANSQIPTSGTALTLTGSQPDKPRRLLLTFGNEGSNRTLVLVGTNATGNKITETLSVTAGAGGTVATVQDFLTLVSATPAGGGWTATVTLGTNTVASSPWQSVSHHFGPTNMSIGGIASGTVNWGIEYTYDEYQAANTIGPPGGNVPPVVNTFKHAVLQNETASADGVINDPIRAWRLVLNSGSGSVTATGIQSGTVNQR